MTMEQKKGRLKVEKKQKAIPLLLSFYLCVCARASGFCVHTTSM